MSAVIEQDTLNFRLMSKDDLTKIMTIEQSVYPFPWSLAIFQDCLRVSYCSWVLERETLVTSYGIMSIAVNECHILNLCVRQELQGVGLGKMMLNFLLDMARRHNAEMAFLEVHPSNENAIRLYNKVKFNEIGVRRNYYPAESEREDALIMARSLV